MAELQRRLSLFSLVMAVVTSTIGSGWLFAPYLTARLAGGAALISWLLGGVMTFLLALVFAELGALVNSSGALAQIPLLTHGRLAGFIGGWSVWLGYVALPTIEVLATVQYLGSSLPWLTRDGGAGAVLSSAGVGLACLLLVLFAWVNLRGVAALARWINAITVWKLVVPLGVSIAMFFQVAHWGNLRVGGAPSGGMLDALSTGGILFSLLGFRTAMDLAGEARRPQRDVPLAMALGLGVSLIIYLALQLSFQLAVPPELLAGGWSKLSLSAHAGPLVAVMLSLGLGGLASLLITDAVVSPSATAMAYLGTAARVNWMMARCQLLPAPLGRLNAAGVPGPALVATVVIGLLVLQGGSSWGQAVGFVTAALVIALAMGPVSLEALRRQAPRVRRSYRLPLAQLLCPLAFVLATWAIFWCGWSSLRFAVPLILVPSLIYSLVAAGDSGLEWRSGIWWLPYLGGLCLASWLMGPGRPLSLGQGAQLLMLAVFALLVFPLAVRSCLAEVSPHAMVELEQG
jgi:amino acid transporter